MLVDATFHAIADVGSIPTVSTHGQTLQSPLGDWGVFLVVDPRRGLAAVAQRDEQVAQLVALVGAQAGEDGVLCLSLRLGGALQLAPAGLSECDDVAAAVGGVEI